MGTHAANKAIILSDCGKITTVLYYRDVYKLHKTITNFLSQHIIKKHQCVGLKMTHNIYIPSLILSLQELQHAFIFLAMDGAEASFITKELGLMWIVTIGVSDNNKTMILLKENDHLILEKTCYEGDTQRYKDVSYVVRTSGTTGLSKFVRVQKYCIESNIKCLSRIFNVDSSDTIYFGTPLTFDPSMVELFLSLHNSACLLITPSKNQTNFHNLHKTLFDSHNGVTVLQIVPSLFMRWSEEQISKLLSNPPLRVLAFGGECFSANILKFPKSDHLRIFNLYGITEVSCWATIHETSEVVDDVPIGVPLDDTLIEIRDDLGNKLENEEGEIYIGSETRKCLIGNEQKCEIFRSTGDLGIIINGKSYYRGRKNDVFKRFGHKIHLSKIEELVFQETFLQNKCVWVKSESKLLLFFINENLDANSKDKIIDKVRIKLLHSLPKHYFPDYIDIVRKCPVTSHGKTDKKILKSTYLNRNKNKQVVDVFTTMLCKYFGVGNLVFENSNLSFFEIGGNSVLAIQFISELENEIGAPCPPELTTALFEKDLLTCVGIARGVKIHERKRKKDFGNEIEVVKRVRSDIEMKISWGYDMGACVDATPLVFESRGKLYVTVGSFSHIFAVLDAISGAEIAKFVLPDVIEGSPCISPCQNFLYVGCFDGSLFCLDFLAKKIKWTYSTCDRIKSTPICLESKAIVFGSYDKCVHCVDLENGFSIWKIHVEESITSSPVLQENKIYIATICGTCICLSEVDGQILWTYKSGGPIFGTPCILNNSILWPKVQGSVLCMDFCGMKLWELECGAHLYSSLCAFENGVIFGLHNGCLKVLKVDGNVPELKTIVTMDDPLTTPCIFKKKIVVAGNSGCLFLVNSEGEMLADLRISSQVFSSPKVHENKIYVGCRDNNLYCIEIIDIEKNAC